MAASTKTDVLDDLGTLRQRLRTGIVMTWPWGEKVIDEAIEEIKGLRRRCGSYKSELADRDPTRHLGD